ncbi:MAG: hypothetical protein EAZ53_00585 [Bacteroidetes bacterium]|nr:MAG: hypothetical protein EAZ53_00585 [Bacteroidota bacterium]
MYNKILYNFVYKYWNEKRCRCVNLKHGNHQLNPTQNL